MSLRPEMLINRNNLQKKMFQNIATGSHTRVSKMENWPKSCFSFKGGGGGLRQILGILRLLVNY